MANTESNDSEEQKVYGGVEGPNSMYVKLVSSDDMEFYIKREYALESGTIKAMLSGPGQFRENETNVIHFREIPSQVLCKVCEYLVYRAHNNNTPSGFTEFPIPSEISLELLMAANFLDC